MAYVLCAEPNEHLHFRPGTRPGGWVNRVTEKLFMCQTFIFVRLLSPDIFRWGRVFRMKGWGPKSSACPSKRGKSNLFGGISRDFAGRSRRCPKSLGKKVCVPFLAPRCAFPGPKRSVRSISLLSACVSVSQAPGPAEDLVFAIQDFTRGSGREFMTSVV